MRRVSGHAESSSRASVPEAAAVLRAIGSYPIWGAAVVREVAVLDRDEAGYPEMAEAKLRVEIGPIPLELELILAVDADQPGRVTLTRLPNDPEDEETFVAVWELEPSQDGGTTIRLDIEASVDVPRLVPIGDIGNKLAKRFVDAATAAADALPGLD